MTGTAAGVTRLLLLLGGLVPLLLAGCSTNLQQGAALAKDQTFTWPYTPGKKIGTDLQFDPATLIWARDMSTVQMLYMGLVSLDGNMNVQPDAAASMPDVDKSGTIYTFHLRPNLKFSDGAPLTAKDFAYSINRALDPTLCTQLDAETYGAKAPNGATACAVMGGTYLNHILGANARLGGKGGADHSLIGTGDDPSKGLDVIDPLTLEIRLDQPISYFLMALTYPTSFALEQSVVENPQYAGGHWVEHLDQAGASGPFKVKSYGDGTQLTLEPNSNWQDANPQRKITLTTIVRPLVGSLDEEYDNYRKGQYDYTDVPPSSYTTARGQGDFNEMPTFITNYFGLNWTKAPFDNPEVRRAFALALNKQLLVDRVENGGAIPTNHIVPKGMAGYDIGLKNPPPDATQSLTGNQGAAQDLLKQAQGSCPATIAASDKAHEYCRYITGANPKEIDVYSTSADQNRTTFDLTNTAVQQWASVLHLNVKAVGVPSNTLIGNLFSTDDAGHSTNPYSAWNIGWLADYPDPQDWLSLQFMTGTPNNVGGVHDTALDALMTKADSEQDQTQRMADYNKAEQTVIDAVAWIPFQQGKFFWRQRTWVRGFGLNSLESIPDNKWADVSILDH